MEAYVKHAKFCLICNYADKIIPALQSRCIKFRFTLLSGATMQQRLKEVADAEGYVCFGDLI
jgi:replication factor C subunit 3/5